MCGQRITEEAFVATWVCWALTSLSVMHGKTRGLEPALHAAMHSDEPDGARCLQNSNRTNLIYVRQGFN